MTRFEYFAFGLGIRSEVDLGLPEREPPRADLAVRLAARDQLLELLAASPPGRWLALETEIGTAAVARDGSEVVFAPEGRPSPTELRLFMLGMVMLQVLSLRGVVCLHGSAVRVAGGAAALVGPSGHGKSTIAAALMREGCELISDDLLPLRLAPAGVEALATHPSVRLWDDALRHLGIDPREGVPAPRYDGKYVLPCDREARPFAGEAAPLTSVYLLRREGTAGPGAAGPGVAGLGPVESPSPALLLELARNALGPHWISDEMQRTRLATLGALAERARVRRLSVPPDLEPLEALARAVLDDARDAARDGAPTPPPGPRGAR